MPFGDRLGCPGHAGDPIWGGSGRYVGHLGAIWGWPRNQAPQKSIFFKILKILELSKELLKMLEMLIPGHIFFENVDPLAQGPSKKI